MTKIGVARKMSSELDAQGANPSALVLLVYLFVELGAWWGTASIAYVGGSMGKRNGQNMIEPAAYGSAVAFGPRTRNFRDVVAALLDADGARVVRDGAELTAFVRHALDDRAAAEALGARARRVVAAHLGATRRTVDLLDALQVPSEASPSRRTAA